MNPPTFFTASLLVAAGGALGSWLRFLVGRGFGPLASAFPWHTLTVNVVGSLAMGLLAGWLARFGSHGESWRLLLGLGLLGGFTTFSSFSLDFAVLVERGALAAAVGYVGLSVVAGLAGLFAGLYLMRVAA
jgi:fluoride exporter